MEYLKVCEHCGKAFATRSANAKYCCDSCRTAEFKSNARKGARAESKREKEKAAAAFRKDADARRRQYEQERQEKAAAGDPLQRMLTAKKYSLEFWEYYRGYLLQIEPGSTATVDGIPVTDPDFPALVMAAIDDLGIIQTRG